MIRILLGNLLQFVSAIIGLSLIAFLIVPLSPGDPITLLTGEQISSTKSYQQWTNYYQTDTNYFIQFAYYLKHLFIDWNWGVSIANQVPVLQQLKNVVPASLELSLFAIALSLLLGFPLGVFAAINHGRVSDYCINGFAVIGFSMPLFWWGLLMILFFSLTLFIAPVAGRINLLFDIEPVTGFILIDTLLSDSPYRSEAFLDALSHFALPVLTLMTLPLAIIIRITRRSMLDVLSKDYIKTAYVNGLPRSTVIWRHAFRSTLVAFVPLFATHTSIIVTGAILTETIFQWPGLGKWLIDAISRRDYPAIQASVMMLGLIIITIHTLQNLLYCYINPRIRNSDKNR